MAKPIFAALASKDNAPMTDPPTNGNFDAFVAWLGQQRNDLQSPAISQAPEVGVALTALAEQPGLSWAGMSGSGATCVGLARNMDLAEVAAEVIRRAHTDWWVIAAPMAAPI